VNNAVLILGATSAIARAIASELAVRRHNLILAARDTEEAGRIASDLRIRHGVEAIALPFDAADLDRLPAFFDECVRASDGALRGVVLAQGTMAPQADAQNDPKLARAIIDVNYTSAALLLNLAANHFEPRKSGFICGISSVAGDRGRQSNYVYGSAKAGLTTLLQGLRNRLTKSNVPVITVKPGFVDTAMTWGLPGLFLVASPQKVAGDVCRAIEKGKATIYTPWFWWGIMTIIKNIPEPIFRRMKL
jgi:decaprenylphospho-beta-D-erythro-pentofuranosid-2-ulose 2-reductase